MKEWKGRWKKGLSVFLTMAVICSGVNVPAIPAFAEESVGKGQEEELAVTVPIAEDELPDSDELFAGYVEKVFYEGLNDGISTYGNLGEQRLQGEYNKKIYAVLKEKVKEVAAGKETNTIFKISLQGITSAAGGELDIHSIMSYLLADCPYELYWFDKTKKMEVAINGLTVTIPLAVADEYKAGDYTVSSNLATVHTAAENARRIVEKYEGQSDYEKMVGYRKEICDLVSYNTDAAEKPTTPYGNPWQLIWVFDKNATTNVVCEGYAKAFQYLCDMSDFANATCYTVTGTYAWCNWSRSSYVEYCYIGREKLSCRCNKL